MDTDVDTDVDDGIATPRNRLIETMRRGQVGLCLRVTLAATNDLAFLAAAAGFDALYVDLEHSTATVSDAAQVCSTAAALGITPLARLASIHDAAAVPLLDAGCQGLIAPHVQGAAEVRQFVDRCLLPPLGRRTPAGPSRLLGYRPTTPARLAALVNPATLLCVMVEDPQGVDATQEIAGVEGVSLVIVGTQDLSYALGVPGEVDHPRVRSAYAHVARACAATGTAFGIAGVTADSSIASYVALGARFVSAGTDVDILRAAASQRLHRLRSLVAQPHAAP